MSTLVYSPGVSIVIESTHAGPIDVSEDASMGSVTLRENGSHSANITLENPNRKYDGLFTPNDRIIIQMKRFRWMQTMAGYVSRAPYFSAYARQVNIVAECPLKVLKYWPWDRGSATSQALLFDRSQAEKAGQDGGIGAVVVRLLNEVTGWSKDRIHIGRVPEEWQLKYQQVYMRVDQETTAQLESTIGVNPIINGDPVGLFPQNTLDIKRGNMPIAGINPELEALLIKPEDYDVALATIRAMESHDDYKAQNKGDGKGAWATGAYQFMDTTWGNYGGYAHASDAPPATQDEKAIGMVRYIISHYGAKLLNIPYGWYYPKVFTDPTWLDRIPAANEGNKLTLRQYGYKWAQTYITIYGKMRSGATPIGTGASVVAGVKYPIPAGKSQLLYSEVGWGGYQNGEIPSSAMTYTKRTGQGHPLAVQAWNELCDEAEKVGFDFSGFFYRNIAGQVSLSTGAGVKIPGHSNHGWGLAIDVNVLVGGGSKKYPGMTNTAMYNTPEYKWLQANASKFGFLNPPWGQNGGSKPEAWHWEFVAFYSYKDGGNANPLTDGINASADTNLGDFSNPTSKQLYSILASWMQDPGDISLDSQTLWGYRALMNDEPIMVTIDQLVRASGRSYCSAPNGDFMAWFPDYWGEYGVSGAMDIETVELKDFTVDWDDASLVTHQFVEGAYFNFNAGAMPAGIMDGLRAFYTRGIVTVDMPGILDSLINVQDARQYPWLKNPVELLHRFGARVDRNKNPLIYGAESEFWSALSRFTRAWADQFSASVPMTFMPEIFPGMLLRIPFFKVQMYVSTVTHSWDYSSGGGFTTTADTMAISATDGSGFYLFPKGGDVLSLPGNTDSSEQFAAPSRSNVIRS